MTIEQVKRLTEERGIAFFLCSFVEMSGAPKAKLFHLHILKIWQKRVRVSEALLQAR